MRIALTGNPNSGKTTLYNALTGKSERVGNWAGVTVDKKESPIKKTFYSTNEELVAVDLPGAYSMSPFTSEESITSTYVINENPDVIINIVDSTNISRSLFFTTQLLALGIPVVVALNKSDLTKKRQNKINVELLAEKLACPVVETSSETGTEESLKKLIAEATAVKGKAQANPFEQKEIDLKDKNAVEQADKERFSFVNGICAAVETKKVATSEKNSGDKIDAIIAHKWLGIPIFAVVMWCVFAISQTYIGPPIADLLVGWIEAFGGWVGGMVENADPIVSALLVDGIIGGVGAVVGFLPLVMVMYFLIALLEDCGYMARVAVVMDRFFKVVGLSGKSIIPMVIGIGCAIPGVMASRTIKNERERRTTAMITPFMPCGAKLPVIALFAGAFFPGAAWVNTVMYFVGIALIILSAFVVMKITGHKNRKSFFIIELPEYKAPSIVKATLSMLSRAKAFIIKAATIILLCNMAVQIMQTFDWSFAAVAEGAESTSILATIASPFAYLLIPVVGVLSWQLAAAAITGFIAKENVVGTLAVVFAITNFIDTDALELTGGASEVAVTMGITSAAALAYLMFNLYTPPCFAAIGAMNAEMQSAKWLWGGIGLQFGIAFVVGFLVYQVGTIVTLGTVGAGFAGGLIASIAIVAIIVFMMIKGDKKAEDYKLKKAVKA